MLWGRSVDWIFLYVGSKLVIYYACDIPICKTEFSIAKLLRLACVPSKTISATCSIKPLRVFSRLLKASSASIDAGSHVPLETKLTNDLALICVCVQ